MSAHGRGTAGSSALERRLVATLEKYDARPDTGAVRFALESPSRGWSWDWASAAASTSSAAAAPTGTPTSAGRFFIASATKLYVTALVMQLRAEGRLDLRAPAAAYLDRTLLERIHVLRGVDSSVRITVEELLAHTSGIADYFEQRRADGTTQIGRALEHDFSWTLDDVLRITRDELEPRFAPSTPGKAFYSDTNYQLLGALVEAVTGQTYEEALRERILAPLGLEGTYPFTLETLDRYADVDAMLYGTRPIVIPKAMASVRADGGIVSTARDGDRLSRGVHGRSAVPGGVPQRDAAPLEPHLPSSRVRCRASCGSRSRATTRWSPGAADGRPLRRVGGGALLRARPRSVRLGHGQPGQEAEPLVQPADAAGHGVSGRLGSAEVTGAGIAQVWQVLLVGGTGVVGRQIAAGGTPPHPELSLIHRRPASRERRPCGGDLAPPRRSPST